MKRSLFVCFVVLVVGAMSCGPRFATFDRNRGAASGQATRTTTVDWPALDRWSRTNDAPNDVAVVVAIEDYAFLPDIAGAGRNAADWEAWFASRGMKDVFVLRDSNAASEEMLRFADVAAQTAKKGGRLWYVFVGHGAPASDGKDGVLVGMDARQTPESLTARGVRQQELITRLAKGAHDQTIVVVDACFSGQSASGALAPGVQPVLPVKASAQSSKPTVVLTAAQSDQFAGALPTSERPAFSYLLLGALRGWAADGGGRVTAQAAHDWVTRQLRHVPGRTQTPDIAGDGAIVLTTQGREPDPGIADRMRQTAVETTVAARSSGVEVDTGAGVTITQLDGWTPTSPSGALVAFKSPQPNQRMIFVFGWRDPNGLADSWTTELHTEYQRIEEQVRPTQLVRYGEVSTFETAYLANVEGHPTTIHIWDIARPGAFYRVVAMSFDSDKYGTKDYAEFQQFIKLLRFGSAANAPRLSDATPGILGKLSTPPPDAIEYAEISLLPGFENVALTADDRANNVVFMARDAHGTSYIVNKVVFASPQAASAEAANGWAGVEGTLVVAPRRVDLGPNSGELVEYEMDSGRHVFGFSRTSGRTMWVFAMFTDPAKRHDVSPLFQKLIAGTTFSYP